eukprot:6722932-Lingulodinium_polyedra.AAC.1
MGATGATGHGGNDARIDGTTGQTRGHSREQRQLRAHQAGIWGSAAQSHAWPRNRPDVIGAGTAST